MISKALLVRFESQTDEDTMDTFLEDLSAEVSWEKTTKAWFGIRYMRGEFGVFVCFADEAGRQAHLDGPAAAKFFAAENRLMTAAPRTLRLEVLASKMPAVLENVAKGLVLRFKAKSGKEAEVAQFLRDAQAHVEQEPGTLAWFAVQYDESHFGIFDVFADNGARFAHLTGHIPRELAKNAFTLLGGMPEMHLVDVMARACARQDALNARPVSRRPIRHPAAPGSCVQAPAAAVSLHTPWCSAASRSTRRANSMSRIGVQAAGIVGWSG